MRSGVILKVELSGRVTKVQNAMIYCINHKTIHHFGRAFVDQFYLRYDLLVDGQYWDLSRYQGMEYDQYDTPATTYLVSLDKNGRVCGSVRAVPTDRPYMIKDIWPELIANRPMPQSLSVWEASRFCVSKHLSREERTRVKNELVLSFLEFGLLNDIREMVGIMPPKLWQSVFVNAGWGIDILGPEKDLGKDGIIVAGGMPISLSILETVREKTGIGQSVLRLAPEPAPLQAIDDIANQNVVVRKGVA